MLIWNGDYFLLLVVWRDLACKKYNLDLFVLIYVDVFSNCNVKGVLVFVLLCSGVISILVCVLVEKEN